MAVRILHVSSARIYGGGERHFVDLCRGLHDRGHDVFVALRPTSEWQNRIDFLPPERVFQVSIRNSFGVLSAMRIAEFVRENQIEIIHAHVARDYIPASIACLAAKDSKFVLTRHVLFPLKPFNRFALKNVSKAIGVSDSVGENLKRVFPAEKVEVILNGIAITPAAGTAGKTFRDTHSIPPDAPMIGTLGELKELKGQRDFVLAAREVLKEIPDARFVIVGKDNSPGRSFRRELKRLVSVFRIEDRFVWLDWLDDTAGFYMAIDVFVSPSYSESFGLAMLEAMLHARAVAATDTDGARQLFGRTIELCPINEPVRLAGCIIELLGDENRRYEIGSALKKRAEEHFSLERMIEAVESLYRML